MSAHDGSSHRSRTPENGHQFGLLRAASTGEQPSEVRISVILPTFNRRGYIGAAIESVLGQTISPYDFVIVDDGSTDGTSEVVDQYGPHVRYVRQVNQGKMVAIERGLTETRGDLVWIMDDDDIACPNALDTLAEPLRRDRDVIFSYGQMVKFVTNDRGDIVEGEKSDYPTRDSRPFLLKLMEDCFITGHPCVLVRRMAFEKMLPFDRSITSSVDYYFHLHMALLGSTAAVDEVVLLQRQHQGPRGPAEVRYDVSERAQRWKQSDQILIRRMLYKLTLEAFDPMADDDSVNPPLRRRACLVQRAAIAARKQLWKKALEDLSEAFAIESDNALTNVEFYILSRFLGCRYGVEEVYRDPAIVDRLRGISTLRPQERGIPGQLGRPLLHQMKIALRSGNPHQFRNALKLWLRLMDFRSGMVACGTIAMRAFKRTIGKTASEEPRNA
jgi:glycosyltransferase involved in cell wall biosynthesis